MVNNDRFRRAGGSSGQGGLPHLVATSGRFHGHLLGDQRPLRRGEPEPRAMRFGEVLRHGGEVSQRHRQ
jgi:hypothetical protein